MNRDFRCVAAMAAGLLAIESAALGIGFAIQKPSPKKPPSATPVKSDPATIAKGKKVYDTAGCNVCHVIDGKGGAVGPDLSRVGASRTSPWIQVHVADPKKHNPASTMPPYGDRIKGAEMAAIVAYLAAHKGASAAPKTGTVPNPDPAIIAKIEKFGGRVMEIAQNDPHLEIDYHLSGNAVTDTAVAPIATLKGVVQLHLGKTGITDAGLAHLRALTELTNLHLEETKITDRGLVHLKGLTNLTYLNLYGTQVTDAGLEQLAGLKKLKRLYVWQTKVTQAGADKLKQSIPQVEVVMGFDAPAKPAGS